MTTSDGWVPGSAVPALAGITYRQFDWWVRHGHIEAAERPPGAGSGTPRLIHVGEVEVARLMGELTRAGLDVREAGPAARQMLTEGRARLGPFVLRRAPALGWPSC